MDFWEQLWQWVLATGGRLMELGWLRFVIFVLLGFIGSWFVKRLMRPLHHRGKLPAQVVRMLQTTLVTLVWVFATIQALHAVGVDLVSVLGAAGVVGIAVGFASQTTLSNFISGIFLVGERSVSLGDYIRVNGVEGSVEAINLLSVSLRQGDNSLIRIPIEDLIKNPMVNITGDHMRRIDFDLGVDYASDLKQVRECILRVVQEQPLLVPTPAPVVLFSGFGDSSLDLHVGAWCRTGDYHEARFHFAHALLAAFAQEGINIPFPVRQVMVSEGSLPAAPDQKQDA